MVHEGLIHGDSINKDSDNEGLTNKDKFEEATTKAIAAYESIAGELENLPPHSTWCVASAGRRVLQVLNETDQPDLAKEWEKKLETLSSKMDELYANQLCIGDAERINSELWPLIASPAEVGSPVLTDAQLDRLRAVCKKFPRGMFLNSLGLAEFRMGHYREAIAAAKKSLTLLPVEVRYPGPYPGDYAVLAASHLMIGEKSKADRYQVMMNNGMSELRFRRDHNCQSLVGEVNEIFANYQLLTEK